MIAWDIVAQLALVASLAALLVANRQYRRTLKADHAANLLAFLEGCGYSLQHLKGEWAVTDGENKVVGKVCTDALAAIESAAATGAAT